MNCFKGKEFIISTEATSIPPGGPESPLWAKKALYLGKRAPTELCPEKLAQLLTAHGHKEVSAHRDKVSLLHTGP